MAGRGSSINLLVNRLLTGVRSRPVSCDELGWLLIGVSASMAPIVLVLRRFLLDSLVSGFIRRASSVSNAAWASRLVVVAFTGLEMVRSIRSFGAVDFVLASIVVFRVGVGAGGS